MDFAAVTPELALAELASSADGLSPSEARQRGSVYGPNSLSQAGGEPLWRRALEPFRSLFVIVLLIAAGLSVATGEYLDAGVMTAVLTANAVIFYFQQYSAGRVLRTLRNHDVRKAAVMRSGKPVRVATHELVPGDVVLLSEGGKVPADGRLLSSHSLHVDESLLTGESVPVVKSVAPTVGGKAVHEMTNMVFSGSLVRSGTGEFLVTSIGNDTEIGHIAELSQSKPEPSPLQRKIDRLAGQVVVVIAVVLVLIFALSLYRGLELTAAVRFLLSLAVAAVPEGLPVALTLVLLLSVQRMAKRHALVRRLSAVETLGQVGLIATDKTGTMTKNELELAKFVPYGIEEDELRDLLRRALSTQRGHTDDPLEALIERSLPASTGPGRHHESLPFEQTARMSGAVWNLGSDKTVYVKGAPEHVVAASDVTRTEARHIHEQLELLSSQGYRVIAVAHKPTHIDRPQLGRLRGMSFDGLVALADGLRPGVPAAVKAAHEAGIGVVMLTGDNPATATTIARLAGIVASDDSARPGSILEGMGASAVRQEVARHHAFARVLPEHKYAVLNAYRGKLVTAMTGDGVNDVPALIKADVGIAVGRGSDAAKEAADIILLNNSFATIVDAVKAGRAILANVRKMLMYLFTTTVGEVGAMAGALLIGMPLPITAIQILWINIITDGIAVIPLGLEAAETNQMKDAPVAHDAPLLSRRQLWRVALGSVLMASVVLGVFAAYQTVDAAAAQTMAFLSLVAMQWANALAMRSEHTALWRMMLRPNWLLTATLGIAVTVQAAVVFTPLRMYLQTVPIGPGHALVVAGVFGGYLLASEAIRVVTAVPARKLPKHERHTALRGAADIG